MGRCRGSAAPGRIVSVEPRWGFGAEGIPSLPAQQLQSIPVPLGEHQGGAVCCQGRGGLAQHQLLGAGERNLQLLGRFFPRMVPAALKSGWNSNCPAPCWEGIYWSESQGCFCASRRDGGVSDSVGSEEEPATGRDRPQPPKPWTRTVLENLRDPLGQGRATFEAAQSPAQIQGWDIPNQSQILNLKSSISNPQSQILNPKPQQSLARPCGPHLKFLPFPSSCLSPWKRKAGKGQKRC